jgi:hypothetical protein
MVLVKSKEMIAGLSVTVKILMVYCSPIFPEDG